MPIDVMKAVGRWRLALFEIRPRGTEGEVHEIRLDINLFASPANIDVKVKNGTR